MRADGPPAGCAAAAAERADVVVVGAGPAGLAAAAVLAGAGLSVLVLEREGEPGGVPRHCGHSPYGMREFGRVMGGRAYAARLAERARRAGAQIRPGVAVVALRPGPRLLVTAAGGPAEIAADQVLLATGAREGSRAARGLGGTRPGGVLNTGALQGLVYLERLRPFRRPVVLGTELVSFSALLTCRHAGIRPVLMVGEGPAVEARWPAALLPRLLGVPLRLSTRIEAIEGRDRVEAVILRGPGGLWREAADGVVVTGRFRPESALVAASHLRLDPRTRGPEVDEFGRCSDGAFFAAGNLLRGVETAGTCWSEGRAVARAMLAARAGRLPEGVARPLAIEGGALAWALPQRLAGDGTVPPAFPAIQAGAARCARGRLVLRAGGAETASAERAVRPHRSLRLPLPPPGAEPVLAFEEEP